jgi:hypothetical protein
LFWSTLVNHPYVRSMTPLDGPHQFTKVALYITARQTQTPAHQAFFQENTSDKDLSKSLWKGFLAEHDNLDREVINLSGQARYFEQVQSARKLGESETQELIRLKDRLARMENEKRAPLAIRILRVGQELRVPDPIIEKKMYGLSTAVLSGTSSLGVNFARKATPEEALTMVHSIHHIITIIAERHIQGELQGYNDAVQEVIRSFIRPASRALNAAQQARLDNHQLNCAVLALYRFNNRVNANKYEEWDGIFTDIDATLARAAKGRPVNAKTRYERIISYLPTDDAYHPMEYEMSQATYASPLSYGGLRAATQAVADDNRGFRIIKPFHL